MKNFVVTKTAPKGFPAKVKFIYTSADGDFILTEEQPSSLSRQLTNTVDESSIGVFNKDYITSVMFSRENEKIRKTISVDFPAPLNFDVSAKEIKKQIMERVEIVQKAFEKECPEINETSEDEIPEINETINNCEKKQTLSKLLINLSSHFGLVHEEVKELYKKTLNAYLKL